MVGRHGEAWALALDEAGSNVESFTFAKQTIQRPSQEMLRGHFVCVRQFGVISFGRCFGRSLGLVCEI